MVGTAVNQANKTLESAEIHIRFFNENGQQVAKASKTAYDLKPGERWAFRFVVPFSDQVTDYDG